MLPSDYQVRKLYVTLACYVPISATEAVCQVVLSAFGGTLLFWESFFLPEMYFLRLIEVGICHQNLR